MSLRIGIDVGGTNTDAVLMDGLNVVSKIKTPTTADVTTGITTALRHVLETSGTATAATSMALANKLTRRVFMSFSWLRSRPRAFRFPRV